MRFAFLPTVQARLPGPRSLTMKKNPRTPDTIAGAAGGAALGAAVDNDHPARGATIGGVAGGAAGNYGGQVYKDKH